MEVNGMKRFLAIRNQVGRVTLTNLQCQYNVVMN